MFRLFKVLQNLISFSAANNRSRKIVFYSEGSNYWTHFKGLILQTLELGNFDITYLCSDSNDPGLKLSHPRYNSYDIGDGHIRNWIFRNINSDIVVMTMPDLETYQIKRSVHQVHYVYIQHSLVSLHMAYGKNAFDAFDTIFCAGPHHEIELKEIEINKKIAPKNLFHHGYPRLDQLIEEQKTAHNKKSSAEQSILFAPSWGKNGVIESGKAINLIRQVLEANYSLVLRPHPQTFRYAANQLQEINTLFESNELFSFESNVSSIASLLNAKLMISDWSGAALEYAIGLGKPVIFIDIPRKINNTSFKEIPLIPFEENIRSKIGRIVNMDTKNLSKDIAECLIEEKSDDLLSNVYNIGSSDEKGAGYLINLIQNIRR